MGLHFTIPHPAVSPQPHLHRVRSTSGEGRPQLSDLGSMGGTPGIPGTGGQVVWGRAHRGQLRGSTLPTLCLPDADVATPLTSATVSWQRQDRPSYIHCPPTLWWTFHLTPLSPSREKSLLPCQPWGVPSCRVSQMFYYLPGSRSVAHGFPPPCCPGLLTYFPSLLPQAGLPGLGVGVDRQPLCRPARVPYPLPALACNSLVPALPLAPSGVLLVQQLVTHALGLLKMRAGSPSSQGS